MFNKVFDDSQLTQVKLQVSQKDLQSNVKSQNFSDFVRIQNLDIDNLSLKMESQQNIQGPQINKNQQTLRYRADIDGLRTVAVALVVIFHAWPQFIPGGFIGVDVFFVISGYLITKIIVKRQNFSLLNFYQRRIKRIFPSLAVVLMFITFYSCIYFSSHDLMRVTQTITASTYFTANLQLLWQKRDYFDKTTKTNPALHLWSLGVEEQFYIIWPIIILLIKKISVTNMWMGLALLACISFEFNFLNATQQNQQFDFYFPLCRFWQMAIGGILSIINFRIQNKIIKNIMSLFGFIGIIFSAFKLNEQMIYPGFYALIPTISAVLIIFSGKDALINRYILSSKQFVLGGKISYPLYLWHWPLLVFTNIFQIQKSNFLILLTVLAAIMLSLLTLYYVQRPIRYRKAKTVLILLIIVMIAIGAINKHISLEPRRYSLVDLQSKYIDNLINIDTFQQQLPEINLNQTKVDEITLSQTSINQTKIDEIVQPQTIKNQAKIDEITQSQTLKNQVKIDTQLNQLPLTASNIDKIMQPLPQDYILINGKKVAHIGASKKKRKPSLQQINYLLYQYQIYSINRIFNQISPQSQYYYEKNNVDMQVFQSINQGKKNKLFIIGDSHAEYNSWRFKYLYEQSVKNNGTQSFPTIVLMGARGIPPFSCGKMYNFYLEYIKKHKPTRVLFCYRWLLYWINYKQEDNTTTNQRSYPCCYRGGTAQYQTLLKKTVSKSDLHRELQQFGNAIKTIRSYGTQVYVSTVKPEGPQFDPKEMKFQNTVTDTGYTINLKQFKRRNKHIIQPLQKYITQSGGKILDFSDYECLDGICYRLMPNGFPIFFDTDHPHRYFAKYWCHIFDFLTQF